MKPSRVPDPRKLLTGLAAACTNNAGVPALDEQLQELERRLRCRARQTRDRRLRKLMEPAKPPERALTLRAMEQIRYLRLAFPEEWPDCRLAQGFGVTSEVIRRVLKSRFCPSPERGLKQDGRARLRSRPGGAEPAVRPGTPLGLSQERGAASRGRFPGLPAEKPSVAAARESPWLSMERGESGKLGVPKPLNAAPRSCPTKPPPGKGAKRFIKVSAEDW